MSVLLDLVGVVANEYHLCLYDDYSKYTFNTVCIDKEFCAGYNACFNTYRLLLTEYLFQCNIVLIAFYMFFSLE